MQTENNDAEVAIAGTAQAGNAESPQAEVITLTDLYRLGNLKIPEYQRPYKWIEKNVNNLIDDIISNKDKSEYRLGTLVFHKNGGTDLDIVDGQQRIVTLMLILYAISEKYKRVKELYANNKLKEHKFNNPISQNNIVKNYQLIKQRINDFDEPTVDFLLTKCTFVKIVLNDVSEAFQFFVRRADRNNRKMGRYRY